MGKPSFIIAGVQKGGSTFFYYGLCEHPKIKMASDKEIAYYAWKYNKGKKWYKAHFPRGISGEASAGLLYYKDSPRRIKKDYPNMLIIFLLRNPIDRAYSNYWHNIRVNRGNKISFEYVMKKDISGKIPVTKYDSYISRGIYINYIKPWIK